MDGTRNLPSCKINLAKLSAHARYGEPTLPLSTKEKSAVKYHLRVFTTFATPEDDYFQVKVKTKCERKTVKYTICIKIGPHLGMALFKP